MKTINEYCHFILNSEKLSDKLLSPPEDLVDDRNPGIVVLDSPNRETRILISEKNLKFPDSNIFIKV